MRNQEQVIIKRNQRRNHGPKGGGAWKVAFADFTLAMMSLFLVLWILAVSNQEEREIVANRLRDYSLLDSEANPFDISNSPFPIDLEGKPSVLEEAAPEYKVDGTNVPNKDVFHRDKQLRNQQQGMPGLLQGKLDDPEQLKLLASIVNKMAAEMQARDNLTLQIVPQGLRIQIRDDDNRQMFARGSTRVSPYFHQLLRALAPIFARLDNSIMISGHTDSIPYPDGNYSNWELSGDRAQMARRVLVSGGLPDARVAQVVAMGDTALALPEDPAASANRRIELLLLTSKAEAQLAGLFTRRTPPQKLHYATDQMTPLDRQALDRQVSQIKALTTSAAASTSSDEHE